jgi:hypothetical protein
MPPHREHNGELRIADKLPARRRTFGHTIRSELASRHHRSDFRHQISNASSSIDIRIHCRMPLPIGMHNQNPRSGLRLLDHIRQVMPIVLGQSRTKNYEVKRAPAHRLIDRLAAHRRLYLVTRLLDGHCLRDKHFRVPLTIKNLELK